MFITNDGENCYEFMTDRIYQHHGGAKAVWHWSDNTEKLSPKTLAAGIEKIKQWRYSNESDPLFFKSQAGEADLTDWQAARDKIKNDYVRKE